MQYVALGQIRVAEPLVNFINSKVLPGLSLNEQDYWQHFARIIESNLAQNRALLERRDEIQRQLDDWYRNNSYDADNLEGYKDFLTGIGYLVPEGDDFKVTVENVDREIASVAAPQLVVPINNARFAINAANARWGSLYDGLYGTDMIPNEGATAITAGYNDERGEKVFEFCHAWLDRVLPLTQGSHADATEYRVIDSGSGNTTVEVTLANGDSAGLRHSEQFCGHQSDATLTLLFSHHDLYFELKIDRSHPIGSKHPAGIKDIILEAAVTTIQDCEDSVAAVDVEDKVQVYSNWLEIIQGTLSIDMEKGGKNFTRKLNPDRHYLNPQGQAFSLSGRSLMLVRNTGHHMKTDLALDQDGNMLPEGMIDGLVTVLISMHDLQAHGQIANSARGSIYIVKPKMHGPDEVAFTCKLFSDIEKAYGLPANTVKIGIMDEERRTTVNLKECIRQASDRVIFINTGFLDRTGDEIHTSMETGPMLPKADIKNARWMAAYEDWNVDIGLACGLDGVAQIGKGMWAVPDQLLQMYQTKQAHPEAGANCAWVPSPTAATLHALHYHEVDVKARQRALKQRPRANLDHILSVPLLGDRKLSSEEIQHELDNNAQGILGYVVKWIELGIGCSKVPDIHDIGLMEDRATLRISSQHMANWLRHGMCSEEQVRDTFKRMAEIVDQQNSSTPGYLPMGPAFNNLAFQCALDLVLKGTVSANGYTEDLLQQYRLKVKAL